MSLKLLYELISFSIAVAILRKFAVPHLKAAVTSHRNKIVEKLHDLDIELHKITASHKAMRDQHDQKSIEFKESKNKIKQEIEISKNDFIQEYKILFEAEMKKRSMCIEKQKTQCETELKKQIVEILRQAVASKLKNMDVYPETEIEFIRKRI